MPIITYVVNGFKTTGIWPLDKNVFQEMTSSVFMLQIGQYHMKFVLSRKQEIGKAKLKKDANAVKLPLISQYLINYQFRKVSETENNKLALKKRDVCSKWVCLRRKNYGMRMKAVQDQQIFKTICFSRCKQKTCSIRQMLEINYNEIVVSFLTSSIVYKTEECYTYGMKNIEIVLPKPFHFRDTRRRERVLHNFRVNLDQY